MSRSCRDEEDIFVKQMTDVVQAAGNVCNPIHQSNEYCNGLDLDEVYPNVYIGDETAARNKQCLMKMGITHVVNTAEGKLLGMVDTDSDFYKNTSIKYLGFSMMDLPVSNISQHFDEVANFIDKAVKGGGKVLVHCLMGISRSSTCVLAYLMIKEGMKGAEAVRQVCQHRWVRPNHGFMRQLAQLEIKLNREQNCLK